MRTRRVATCESLQVDFVPLRTRLLQVSFCVCEQKTGPSPKSEHRSVTAPLFDLIKLEKWRREQTSAKISQAETQLRLRGDKMQISKK